MKSEPLTGVVANADAGLRWLARQPPNVKEAQDALDCIVKDGHRAGDVISRIGALIKKAPPQKEGLAINEVILEVIALARGEMVKNVVSANLNSRRACRSFREIESNCNK